MTNPNHSMNCQLYHGDCLEVMPTLPANSVDAVICDPPYGSTACSWDTIIPFDDMWACIKHVLKPSGAVVLFGSEPFSSHLRLSNLDWYKYDWIWQKTRPSGFQHAKNKVLKIHENISIFSPGTTVHASQSKKRMIFNPQMTRGKPYKKLNRPQNIKWLGKKRPSWKNTLSVSNGGRYPTSVISFSNDNHSTFHPTQKPIALMEYLVKTYTNPAQTVLDFTMGSGTTGVACGKLGRNFIGIELLQKYYDIAETRIKNAYGDFVLTEDEKQTGQMSLF